MTKDNDKPRTPPIEPLDYICRVKVVDIGDLRVARGKSRRPVSACPHNRLVYDRDERRIWCKDCETDVEAFDAYVELAGNFHDAHSSLERRERELKEAEGFQIRSIAAKTIDHAWRSKTMVPACPHCRNGLFPEDFRTEPMMLGRDYAAALLKREKQK